MSVMLERREAYKCDGEEEITVVVVVVVVVGGREGRMSIIRIEW